MGSIISILGNFGVSWAQLLMNAVNFIILTVLLTVFAYKPIIKMLDKRKAMIEKSVKDSETIAKQKEEMQKEYRSIINTANLESKKLIEEALAQSQVLARAVSDTAHEEAEKIMAQAKDEINKERSLMYENLKSDISILVASTLEKVLQDTLTRDEQKRILEQAVKIIQL